MVEREGRRGSIDKKKFRAKIKTVCEDG
jgi:hypothetical protein